MHLLGRCKTLVQVTRALVRSNYNYYKHKHLLRIGQAILSPKKLTGVPFTITYSPCDNQSHATHQACFISQGRNISGPTLPTNLWYMHYTNDQFHTWKEPQGHGVSKCFEKQYEDHPLYSDRTLTWSFHSKQTGGRV